jgi:hypothetical protein
MRPAHSIDRKDEHGWYDTGGLGYLTENGHIVVCGRVKGRHHHGPTLAGSGFVAHDDPMVVLDEARLTRQLVGRPGDPAGSAGDHQPVDGHSQPAADMTTAIKAMHSP